LQSQLWTYPNCRNLEASILGKLKPTGKQKQVLKPRLIVQLRTSLCASSTLSQSIRQRNQVQILAVDTCAQFTCVSRPSRHNWLSSMAAWGQARTTWNHRPLLYVVIHILMCFDIRIGLLGYQWKTSFLSHCLIVRVGATHSGRRNRRRAQPPPHTPKTYTRTAYGARLFWLRGGWRGCSTLRQVIGLDTLLKGLLRIAARECSIFGCLYRHNYWSKSSVSPSWTHIYHTAGSGGHVLASTPMSTSCTRSHHSGTQLRVVGDRWANNPGHWC